MGGRWGDGKFEVTKYISSHILVDEPSSNTVPRVCNGVVLKLLELLDEAISEVDSLLGGYPGSTADSVFDGERDILTSTS